MGLRVGCEAVQCRAYMPLPSRTRWLVVGLALVGAGLFALSVQGGAWWSLEDYEVGPFGSRNCLGGCHASNLAWLGGSPTWIRLGMATWAGGLLSTLTLVVVAAGVAAKRIPQLAARTAIVAVGTATIAGIAFFVGYPSEITQLHVDRDVVIFVLAVIAGAAAAVMVLRAHRRDVTS